MTHAIVVLAAFIGVAVFSMNMTAMYYQMKLKKNWEMIKHLREDSKSLHHIVKDNDRRFMEVFILLSDFADAGQKSIPVLEKKNIDCGNMKQLLDKFEKIDAKSQSLINELLNRS